MLDYCTVTSFNKSPLRLIVESVSRFLLLADAITIRRPEEIPALRVLRAEVNLIFRRTQVDRLRDGKPKRSEVPSNSVNLTLMSYAKFITCLAIMNSF